MRTKPTLNVILLMLFLLLVACGAPEQPATEPDEQPAEETGGEAEAPAEGSGEIVAVSWGGTYQQAQSEAYWQPFEEETGITVIEAESPEHARIKAQVDSGNPEWDIVTTGLSALLELGPDYFEPIAYDQYPEAYANVPDDLKHDHAIASITYCYALAYRTDEFGDNPPQTWADFWNPEEFPGPRGMALDGGVPWNSVEAAWIAAGNDASTLSETDMDVVLEQFTELEPHIGKWWGSGAEALQLLTNKEVVMAIAPTGSILELVEQDVPVAISWEDAFCGNDYWYILKGSRNVENAQRLIAYMQDPERQADFVSKAAYGVPNAEAYEHIPQHVAEMLPTHPNNVDKIVMNEEERSKWWADNRETVVERFNEWRLEHGG